MSSSLNVTHWKIEFVISFAFALPCVLTTRPFSPRSGAPPYCVASKVFNVDFNAGNASAAPILLFNVLIMPFLMAPINVLLSPSYSFKMTFPTKASQTITSASPFGISLASMLPTKLMSSHAFSRGNVSFTRALPFSSSAPILTIATLGFFTPRTFSI